MWAETLWLVWLQSHRDPLASSGWPVLSPHSVVLPSTENREQSITTTLSPNPPCHPLFLTWPYDKLPPPQQTHSHEVLLWDGKIWNIWARGHRGTQTHPQLQQNTTEVTGGTNPHHSDTPPLNAVFSFPHFVADDIGAGCFLPLHPVFSGRRKSQVWAQKRREQIKFRWVPWRHRNYEYGGGSPLSPALNLLPLEWLL